MSKFSSFKVTTEVYKDVRGHQILADVYIHNELPAGRHPLIVRIHGGFLITGTRTHEDWFPGWLLEYAVEQSAVIVSPDYRLLPESKGVDILEDLDDFWKWVQTDLPGVIAARSTGLEVDLERIVVTGDSAGGYLAIQLGLSHASDIRAVISFYPMLDLKHPFWTTHYEKLLFGGPMLPRSIIDEHLAAMKMHPGDVVTAAVPPARIDLAIATVQQGCIVEFLGQEQRLFPEERIQNGETLPPLLLVHGTEDTAVPVEVSERFAQMATVHGVPVHFVKRAGEHGFDKEAHLSDEWLKEGTEFVTRALMVPTTSKLTDHGNYSVK